MKFGNVEMVMSQCQIRFKLFFINFRNEFCVVDDLCEFSNKVGDETMTL